MSLFTINVVVMPLKELLDPQGKAVNDSLNKQGQQAISDVRIGKNITLTIEAADQTAALAIADDAAKRMLHNPVMEQYSVTIA
jgi:phosphoribosylformylglycinamidine synthase subunit PurS